MRSNSDVILRICRTAIALAAASIFGPWLLFAQQTTTVTDSLHDPTGLPLTGRLILTNQTAFVSADGFQIPAGNQITVQVSNGSFSVQLIPNVGATPGGTSYTVAYYLPGLRTSETWVVPQTPNPAHLADVRTVTPPIPSTQLAIAQVNPPSSCTGASLLLAWASAGWNCLQPAFSSLSGIASPGQLPSATATAPGIMQLTGDLGNSAASPQVTSTHLAAALPVTQGGTGAGTAFASGAVVFAGSGGSYSQDSQLYWDGTNHRLGLGTGSPGQTLEVNGGARLNTTAAAPPCDSTQRGTFWVVQGGTGVDDDVQVCTKDSSGAYAWRDVFSSARMMWSLIIPQTMTTGTGWDVTTLDQPITVTRVEMTEWGSFPNCTVAPTVTVTDNVTPITLTVPNASNYATATFSQNYAAGSVLRINTNQGTCSTYPSGLSIHVQYQMQ